MAEYGLYDTADNCWMGDSTGPRLYASYMLARIAAQLLDVQLKQSPGRTQARVYEDGPKRLRDEVEIKVDTLTALKGIESGRVM